jgi:hypothetical protein
MILDCIIYINATPLFNVINCVIQGYKIYNYILRYAIIFDISFKPISADFSTSTIVIYLQRQCDCCVGIDIFIFLLV